MARPKKGTGPARRDRVARGTPMEHIHTTLPTLALDRFRLLYPRPGSLRVLMNAALRAALDRPDLCQWLQRSYGPEAFALSLQKQHPKVDHPFRTLGSSPYALYPVLEPLESLDPDDDRPE